MGNWSLKKNKQWFIEKRDCLQTKTFFWREIQECFCPR
jgi:hypothetical protein